MKVSSCETNSGFTLFEMLVTGVLAAIVIAAAARYYPQIPTAVRHIQVQQLMHSQSTTAMDTMVRLLRVGKASTVEICSCNQELCSVAPCSTTPTVVVPPNSQIDFNTIDGHTRRFYWVSNTLEMDDTPPGSAVTTTVLASNVTNISFNLPSAPDFSVVSIDLTINTSVDSAGETKTLILPTQSVRMITNQ